MHRHDAVVGKDGVAGDGNRFGFTSSFDDFVGKVMVREEGRGALEVGLVGWCGAMM